MGIYDARANYGRYLDEFCVGDVFKGNDVAGTIEAVKTVADIFSPLEGTIIAVNQEIENNPELVNSDPYGKGWLMKMKVLDSFELLNNEQYSDIIS